MGYETGVDLATVVGASRSLSLAIGRRPVSRVFQALDAGTAERSV
jgi:hypothetical protein